MGALFDRELWRQFFALARPYWTSAAKWRALRLFSLVVALLLAVTASNVAINFVNAALMTAYAGKDTPTFWRMLLVYAGIFAASTPVSVYFYYCQDKLTLQWRTWLTGNFLERYFHDRTYYHLSCEDGINNPDEQIGQDVRDFCNVSIKLLLALLTSVVTAVSFVTILWRISPALVAVCICYSTLGTLATMWLGRRVAGLKSQQLKEEADFRHNLIHVRNNAESIAFHQGEAQEHRHVIERFRSVVKNFNVLIGWQRNVGFVTQSYNYLVTLIPALIIAPLYFASAVPFGTQAAADGAFSQILVALSLLIASFDDITNFVALVGRLGSLRRAMELPLPSAGSTIEVVSSDAVAVHDLTLMTPSGRVLVCNLSFKLKSGTGLLIVGPSGSGKSSVLRAISGLWRCGEGAIERPALKEILFLPQRPYMTIGTLRSQLIYPRVSTGASDDQLRDALVQVNLPDLLERLGGLDTEINFTDVLSLGEQQRLAFARVLLAKANFVVLDESTSALDVKNDNRLYQLLRNGKTTYISVGHRPNLVQHHDSVLELDGCGGWSVMSACQYWRKQLRKPVDH